MIHNRQGINIPGRSLAMVNASLDTGELLLTNEHPNLVVVPMLHIIQGKKHNCLPLVLVNLNEDEKIFLKKGEILGHLEPSFIEISEIIKEDW